MQGLGQASGGAKSVVGAIQIGEAVSDKDRRQDTRPALAQIGFAEIHRVHRRALPAGRKVIALPLELQGNPVDHIRPLAR